MTRTPADPHRTPLTSWHEEHGGKMIEFAGFRMPVNYGPGVLAEHAAVRERVGLFDITHMGELRVTGDAAGPWLEGLVTNKLAGAAPGKVVYTPMCREDGGVLDDMLVYRLPDDAGAPRFLVVCNAANREKIAGWLRERLPAAGVALEDASFAMSLIAVQGPDSRELLRRLPALTGSSPAVEALSFYNACTCAVDGREWIVSRTGYTGEHGYEIYLPNEAAPAVWRELLEWGKDLGAVPVGLAARDTLRFEVGYCLYGNELAEDVTPLEAGIGWAVKFKKDPYVGMESLRRQKREGVSRRLIGLAPEGRGIARPGFPVLRQGSRIGRVTSGTFSPTLGRPLAMALVDREAAGDALEVEIRGKPIPCRVVQLPFLAARVKGDPRAERDRSV